MKDQMKIAEIGDSVTDNGSRNNTSMIVDIGDSVADDEDHHQTNCAMSKPLLHNDDRLWLLCGRG